MKVVFCTTCKDRAFHLQRTLPKNLAGNPRATFVVLNYGSNDNLMEVLESVATDRLRVYNYKTRGSFRMAHAKNMAHRLGMLENPDVLVNLDADNFMHDGFEDWIEANFKGNSFLWSGMIQGLGNRMRGTFGRIAVTPAAFIKAGGYDEKYDDWGPDDKDFNMRVTHLGYQAIEIDHRYLESIPHGDGVRFREYPHARDGAGERTELAAPTTAVANFGNVGLGDVTRPDGSLVTLVPIPTRIFGIGLHKTATTSLHAAFKLLGYESVHWGTNGWASAVWNEVRTSGVSPSLERFYAAVDLPIGLLYKELDHAYPGSKFILTVRNEVDWLRSVRDHWSYEHNPHRWEWDAYPISNRIHQALYGRKDFDAETFLARYLKHNKEVMAYFKDRPDDLLVMDQPGWGKLCQFLHCKVPTVEYPRQFVTKREDASEAF